MKTLSRVVIIMITLSLVACGKTVQPVTDTPQPLKLTDTPQPVEPTDTPLPTESPTPTTMPSPTWVPGQRIVFVSNRGEDPQKRDLFILDLDTMVITPLNTGFDSVLFPKWSPDGSKILFTVKDIWNIYTIDADGTNLTQITNFSSNNADWSPDGRHIVFQSDHQNEPKDTPDIYMIDANGENLTEIHDDPAVLDFSPRWSPDGNQIMYISGKTGNYEIFLMNADGSNPTQLTTSTSPIIGAAWSPNGKRIVYTFLQSANNTDLYTIDADGSNDSIVQLTRGAVYEDGPAWSSDGEKIVFFSDRSGNLDLWIINADGTNLVQLTNDAFYDAYPDWLP
ncbi:MAG: DUF5050 domain-containing protein [Chloroflexota bacterium]